MISKRCTATVVGGGLLGVTTAFELQRRGITTTLVEELSGLAFGASFANGSMLTPSMSDPWNAPGVFGELIRAVGDPKAAIKLRLSAFPSCVRWGFDFLRNANLERYRYATDANFLLARYSLDTTRLLRDELELDYNAADHGTMKIFRDESAATGSLNHARALAAQGLKFERLTAGEAISIEPALGPIRAEIAAALYYPEDGAGDAHLFCRSLAKAFQASGGSVCLNDRVTGLEFDGPKVAGIRTASDGVKNSDIVVLAAGSRTPSLARDAGIRLPIQPVKGYSLTLPMPAKLQPVIPIVDDAFHAAVVPFGDKIRVAGTAEIAGDNRAMAPERIENLIELLWKVYPTARDDVDLRSAIPWTGLRPMSADGLPFIGATPVEGLFINSGHGHLGWTCAVGSAKIAADLISGRRPEIDPEPYRADR